MSQLPCHIHALHGHPSKLLNVMVSSPLRVYEFHPLHCLIAHHDLLQRPVRYLNTNISSSSSFSGSHYQFTRTTLGDGVSRIGAHGSETFSVTERVNLTLTGCWSNVNYVALLDGGRKAIMYCKNSHVLFVYPADPPIAIFLPGICSMICVPIGIGCTSIFAITEDLMVINMLIEQAEQSGGIHILSQGHLPNVGSLQLIIPVDYSAWGKYNTADDVLVSFAVDGEAMFWAPSTMKRRSWVCTKKLHTYRTHIIMAKCNSANRITLGKPTGKG